MATRTIVTPNVTFHALDEGKGPLVLCLHGFPDVHQEQPDVVNRLVLDFLRS